MPLCSGKAAKEIKYQMISSPYKFSRDVLSAISDDQPETGFAAMDRLHQVTGVDVPPRLAKLRDMPTRFNDCVDRDAMLDYVKNAVGAQG